jgi:UDP-2-acetamido-2-deoxy-ribo-hexuluronate aminotransferase
MLENEEQRNELQIKLKEQGIPTMIYYPKPLHLQTAFAFCGLQAETFPVAEEVSRCVLSLPIHPYLDIDGIGKICREIIKYFNNKF